MEKNDQQDEQEDHVAHESHKKNTITNIEHSQCDNYDAPQEHDTDPIKESTETETTVHIFSGISNHPINRIQLVRQSVQSKNSASRVIPSLSGENYETTLTTFLSGVNFHLLVFILINT